MVTPSEFSKDVSVSSAYFYSVDSSASTTEVESSNADTLSVHTSASSELTDTCSQKGLHATKLSRFRLGVIMNPAVLSIIAHFPNKCVPKKSDKYVVNGLPTPDPPSERDKGSDNNTKSHNNNNSQLKPPLSTASKPKNKSSSKFRRYAGLLLAILSSMMFSFTGLIVKVINHHHPLTQATWMFVGTVVVAIPLNLLKYVYTYYRDIAQNGEKRDKKAERFKSLPDNIEPVLKMVEKSEGVPNGSKVGSKGAAGAQLEATFNSAQLPSPAMLAANKLARRKHEERRRKIKLFLLLLIRACSGCSGMILYFYSLKYLNVGDSLVIVCSSPIFVFIIGYLFLGESCGIIPVLTILLCMAGVSVITRPPMLTGKESFEADDMIGAGLAFSSMLCIAMTIILMRFLQNVYHGLINLIFGIWGTIQTTTLALAVGVLECPRDLHDAILMSATGVLFFLGQTFLAVALQFEEAGPVSLVRTSEVVFAFVWQFIFLQVAPDIFSITGAGLILAGIFLTISRKWIASLPESSPSRKMFSFLLR